MAIAFATLWVAAGLHCRLEALAGLEFLSCSPHAGTEKTPAQHEKDCADDGCAAVESGLYKLEQPQQAPVKPCLALVAWIVPVPDLSPASALGAPVAASPAPPDLPTTWQFFRRTALPARAPSLAP